MHAAYFPPQEVGGGAQCGGYTWPLWGGRYAACGGVCQYCLYSGQDGEQNKRLKTGPEGHRSQGLPRILATHYQADPSNNGPSWLITIGHAEDSLWSVDLFRCESILLKSHWVMVVVDQYTRRIIGFGVHAGNVDGPVLCRMFNDATSGQGWPKYLSSDNDPLFQYHRWKANLRMLEVEEIKSLPHVPMSHPFVERLIGSIRRELLDHTFFWTATDLENKLREYQVYYNEHRCHSGQDGRTPVHPGTGNVVDLNSYRWKKHCHGLFQLPVSA